MNELSQRHLHADIVECLPHLRAFAYLLARDRVLADELVQDAVVQALAKAHQFEPGINFRGWMVIILRNRYFNLIRKNGRRSEVSNEIYQVDAATSGGQEVKMDLRDFKRVFEMLPPMQREALLLVGVSGFSYEEAAQIAGYAVGTIKSRASRARTELEVQLLGDLAATTEAFAAFNARLDSDDLARPAKRVAPASLA
jgi:RNA polymerase sigma-70 factor (ECF subfamily)